MRQFTTDKVIIEMTKEELELLMSALNSAEIRRREQGVMSLAKKLSDMWCELYDILKGLDK